MDEKKLMEIAKDKEFVGKLLEATTEEEVKSMFQEKDMKLENGDIEKLAEIISKAVDTIDPIKEKELENVSGGAAKEYLVGAGVGAGVTAVAATVGMVWAFKKGVNYANSWWEKMQQSKIIMKKN